MKRTTNKVFIATSIDGYIADSEGKIDWLTSYPTVVNDDMGYALFLEGVDAIVMGRNTFETVLGFGIEWPYPIPVFVLSSTLNVIPENLNERVFLIAGGLTELATKLNEKGYKRLYIDGGKTIQSFLNEDLIHEMTITVIPVLLGSGIPLFDTLNKQLAFECIDTILFPNKAVQHKFVRRNSIYRTSEP